MEPGCVPTRRPQERSYPRLHQQWNLIWTEAGSRKKEEGRKREKRRRKREAHCLSPRPRSAVIECHLAGSLFSHDFSSETQVSLLSRCRRSCPPLTGSRCVPCFLFPCSAFAYVNFIFYLVPTRDAKLGGCFGGYMGRGAIFTGGNWGVRHAYIHRCLSGRTTFTPPVDGQARKPPSLAHSPTRWPRCRSCS